MKRCLASHFHFFDQEKYKLCVNNKWRITPLVGERNAKWNRQVYGMCKCVFGESVLTVMRSSYVTGDLFWIFGSRAGDTPTSQVTDTDFSQTSALLALAERKIIMK